NLITQDERGSIQGYEIIRGDRTANESIKAKGIAFDMMRYKEDNKDILYSNYPFNDLGPDRLFYENQNGSSYIQHPFDSKSNSRWTFHSPNTDYNRISVPSLMNVEGYLFGRSKGNFGEVRDYSEWVILGDSLENLAGTLATLEAFSEVIIKVAELTSRQWFVAGFVGG